jgi:NAD(P)-dependent dehydrogenase (short-subunit alcohol dehydrogenase family)
MENGRIVVVTGGAGGIGSKIVDRFLANGDTIFAINNRLGGPTWNLDRRAPLKCRWWRRGTYLLPQSYGSSFVIRQS